MPDGYTIKIEEKAPASIQNISDVLCETNSPRWLFPKRTETRPLHIVEKPAANEEEPGPSTYMFSRMLNDLNELWEKQEPFFERQNDENSELLSMSVSDGQDTVDAESEPNFKEMSFLRSASDYPFSFLPKKEEPIEEAKKSEDEESEEDSIDITDDVENENYERFNFLNSTKMDLKTKFNSDFSAIQRKTFIQRSVDGVCGMSTIRNTTKKKRLFNFVRVDWVISVWP